MELHLPKSINKFYWTLFPIIFVIRGYYNVFKDWELQNYSFNELEDFGRLLFVLGISFFESALITVFIWGIIKLFKRISE